MSSNALYDEGFRINRSASMPSSDPCQEKRLEQERQKREKYLHRKVQETLSLAVPEQPTTEKVCAHGTCSLTSEELKAQCRQYKDKLRTNRILQVRAQEMLFASQRIAQFRDRKTKDSKMLINHLKEVWCNDQRRRIASLEEEYANACQSIGLSHDAALLVERNKAAKEELLARQAEESRYWDTLRFEEAMQKEREQKELRERGDSASALRRKIVESVSSIERSFARRYNHGTKPKPQEKEIYGCSQTVNLPVTHDVTREKVYSKLAGFPIDFKDTYLHSRFDVLQDSTNRPCSAVVNCPEQEEIDAWRAAEQQRESNRCERARQIELERLYNERKLERGSAAAAKLLNDERIALLEQEVEEAFREEEREKDRLQSVTNLSTCKRATSAGQQRRHVYTKHKISKPLSCPGSIITQSPENQQETIISESQTVISGIKRKPKSLQDHPVSNSEKQDMSKIDVQGTRIQLVDHASYQAQQGATVHKEGERELSGERLSNRKSADGSFMNSSQQHNATDEIGLILEPSGVIKFLPQSPLQTKRKGISPIRASCEKSELSAAENEEGSVTKQPRVKSPNKCPMPKQNADGSDRTGKRQFHGSKKDVDDIAGPARRWRSREKEREKASWIKHLSDKASPGKTRYHMELVQEAAEVEKEVEQYYKGIHHRRVSRNAAAAAAAHPVTHDTGETHRSQRDPSNGTRPPFISSGTIGYKKILPGPLIPRTSRPIFESEGNKAAVPNEEKVSLIRSVKDNFTALSNARRGPDVDIVKENLQANVYASPLSERHHPPSGTHASSLPDINKQGMETSKSWAHPLRPNSEPANTQDLRKSLKTVNGAKWATREDQPKDDHGLGKDSALKGVGRDPVLPRNRNKVIRSRFESWDGLAGSGPSTEMLFEIGKPREEISRNGNGSECQEKRVQEPKPRQKAVWKSYIGERKQASRRNLETPTGNRSIKSEPSSPPARIERVISSRPNRPIDQQDDYQPKARLDLPVVKPNARNCYAPAASLSTSRSKFSRDKSVPRSWKYPQANFKGIEVEALENISTKMKSLSNRIHSPMTQVSQERRNRKDLNSKEINGFPTELSTRREKPQKLDDIRSSCEAVASHPNGHVAEEEGSTRKDADSKCASIVADTQITAWKTGKFEEDYVKAMKRAKEITSGSCSSGVSKIFSDRNYSKPWLSRSPFRRSVDREMDVVSLDNQRHNERSGFANPRTDHNSATTTSRMKPWLSNSSSRSPDRMMDEQENHKKNHGTANPEKKNRSPMTRSNAANIISPKQTNWTNQSQLGPETSKSSPVKTRVGKEETTKDPWEGQSLDFVLGSLAEQVRELDERIRSATESSPALSSSPSLDRELYIKRDKRTVNQPHPRLPDTLHKVRDSPSPSSIASSPERGFREINRGPPAARNVSRGNMNGYTLRPEDPSDRAAGKPAFGGTYMDELKTLLREISIDNPSPLRRNQITSSPVTRKSERDIKYHNVQGMMKRAEILNSMNKNANAIRAKTKTEVEAGFVSSTSISANSLRACSVTSRRDSRETRVMVENGRAPVDGNGIDSRISAKRQLDRVYENGNGDVKERDRASNPVTNRTFEVGEVRETKTCERRNVRQENGFREDNGIRRVLEKRLVQSRWTHQQAAEYYTTTSVQERLEKRTVEVRGYAPHQVIHSGQAVIREQLVKEVVENGLPSPEQNGHDSFRTNTVTPIKDRKNHNHANGKVIPVKQRKDAQESDVLQQVLPTGKTPANGIAGRPSVRARGSAAHGTQNGHKTTTVDPRGSPMQRMENHTKEYALSNGTEKLRSRQPESPLWGEGSPHCSGSWRKGGANSEEAEDRMLLSGSVDFSPWNTAKIPDIQTPQNVAEKRSRSKPPSPIAEVVGNGNSSPRIRSKAAAQRPMRKDALPNGENLNYPNPAPVRESMHSNTNSLKSQAHQNLKRPKPVPRGIDALWSVDDEDAALKPSAAQNGCPPRRKKSPYEMPVIPKRRPASASKSRLVKEQTASQEEMPDSTSKSSQDDNYLPVIMAKDPESRQRVIERRKKALQLDMEHRQRLRNSRPSSARNSL